MQKKNYVQEILDIIHSGLPQAELAEKLSDYHENDLADALADLTAEERRKLYAILGVEQVAEIFSYLDDAEPYLKELPPEEASPPPEPAPPVLLLLPQPASMASIIAAVSKIPMVRFVLFIFSLPFHLF